MHASRAGHGPILVIALSIAAVAALRGSSELPQTPAPVQAVRVELRSPVPSQPTPQVVVQPPQEVRCCACAMERSKYAWREQQQRKRRAR